MAGDAELDELDRAPEDEQRPSIGQLIAGIKQPSYMPKVAGPDSSAPPPDARPPFDPNAVPDAIRPRAMSPDEVPVAPTGRNNPNLASLAQEQAKYATPINPMDPATGKIQSKYRLGTGGKILGTVANALMGFGGRGGQPVDVSSGATNWRFGREEQARQGQLEGVNAQIKTQEQLDSENEKLMRDAMRGAYEGQVGEARKETAGAQAENAATRKSLEASQAELNTARANKADTPKQPTNEIEVASALQDAKAKGDKPSMAKWQAVLDELKRQKAAGKDTSAGDIAKALGVAKFRGEEHDKIDRERDTERAKRVEEFSKSKAGQFDFDGKKSAAFQAQLNQELDAKYTDRHKGVDDQADKMLGLTKSGAALKTTPNAPPKSAPKAPPRVGETILVNGKPHRVTGFNPKTKKPIAEPIAGQ